MSDKGILYSAPMVLALLAGRKTQTRRCLSPQPVFTDNGWVFDGIVFPTADDVRANPTVFTRFAVGDRLYVREAWRAQEAFDKMSPVDIGNQFAEEYGEPGCPVFYEADRKCDGSSADAWQQSPPGRLRAGMHMPRWASRITCVVTKIRVQRLQEITQEDCLAEGPPEICREPSMVDGGIMVLEDASKPWIRSTPRAWYHHLWDSLNGDRPGMSWAANPWVVAVTQDVHLCNIERMPA